MSKYRKAIVALVLGMVVAGLVAAQGALADGAITTVEWITIALSVIGIPAAVYEVPNEPLSP